MMEGRISGEPERTNIQSETGLIPFSRLKRPNSANGHTEFETNPDFPDESDRRSDKQDEIDGGLTAWMVVLGAWCAMMPSMGLLNTLAVLEAWMTTHELKDVPKSTAAWVFSGYSFFLYFCGAQVGPVFDAHHIRFVIVPGSVGIVAALIFLSFSTGMTASNPVNKYRAVH